MAEEAQAPGFDAYLVFTQYPSENRFDKPYEDVIAVFPTYRDAVKYVDERVAVYKAKFFIQGWRFGDDGKRSKTVVYYAIGDSWGSY